MVCRVGRGPFCDGAGDAVGDEGAVGGDVRDYGVDWERGVGEGLCCVEGLVSRGAGGEGFEGVWEEGAALELGMGEAEGREGGSD